MGMLIGIDIGGTFTDIVCICPDDTEAGPAIEVLKVPSAPRQEEGVRAGLEELIKRVGRRWEGEEVTRLVHGTTVATNALLEGKWACTALVTTQGFRDVIEIGRQNRPHLYDLSVERPPPIVPRDLRFEVPERLDHTGEVVVELDEGKLSALAEELQKKRKRGEVASIAVSFLFSYVNPEHERRAKAILQRLGLPVTLSSEVLPEFREYERTSTTVISAALRPVVERYLEGLEEQSADLGIRRGWMVMQSGGGIMSGREARGRAVHLLLSGPAAGVAGARFVGEAAGFSNLITLDMGGTSCDVSLVREGRVTVTTEGEVQGRPVRIPMADIHTIGAGGGSIAWIDAGGALRVGPQSAAADPGPACYGKGDRPTVTDAQLVLGRLNPQRPLGGPSDRGRPQPQPSRPQSLDVERARRAIQERIADPLGMGLEEAAWGILEVAESGMERAIRVISVERGHDPRDFTLLAFGGAGPLHGASLAARLGIPRVLIPRLAGVLSALGLLAADVTFDFVRSLVRPTEEVDPAQVNRTYDRFRARGRELLLAEGIAPQEMSYRPSADMRYRGQSYELNLPLPDRALSREDLLELEGQFHKAHKRAYGHASDGEPTELVNLRLVAQGRVPKPSLRVDGDGGGSLQEALTGTRKAFFGGDGWVECRVFAREALPAGVSLEGPLIIEGAESTVCVPPGKGASTDPFGNLIIEVG